MAIIRPIKNKTEILQAIGLVSVFHSALQFELAEVLKVLLDVPARDARFLVSQMSFKATCATIRGLSDRVQDEALRTELEDLLGKAQNADSARNRVLHSEWGVSLNMLFERGAVRTKPKPGDLDHYEVHDPTSIRSIADSICEVVDRLAYYWPRLRSCMRAEPSTKVTLSRRRLHHRDFLKSLEPRATADSIETIVGIPPEPMATSEANEFVVVRDDTRVGYVALVKNADVWHLNCVMHEQWRGMGLATAACREALSWGRSHGLRVAAIPLDKPESRRLVEKLARLGLIQRDDRESNIWLAT